MASADLIGMPKLSGAEAVRIVRCAIDAGLNFLDNSWDYNDGVSETRIGNALKDGYRAKAFVMTKIDGRTKKEANKQIDESLRRLQVDHVDLLQHHEVIRFDDPDRIFAEGGAMEAFLDAMLRKAKEQDFHFDAVQMPLNLMDAHFRSFEKAVLPILVAEGIGVLGMKSMGSGVLLKSQTAAPADYLRYALSLPASVVITGIDSMEILNQALDVARNFRPLTQAETQALLTKTAAAAANGEFELFKTTSHFDSTAHNPAWLGDDPDRVKVLDNKQ